MSLTLALTARSSAEHFAASAVTIRGRSLGWGKLSEPSANGGMHAR